MRDGGDDPSHGGLGEPETERFIGRRDLTTWSAPARRVVTLVLRAFRNVPALRVLLLTSAIGAGIAILLTWAAEEIYDSVKAADGLARLDEPALELAIRLRTPQNVDVALFITNLGGAIGLTIISVVILATMTIRWRSRTPLVLLTIGAAGSLLMTAVGKELVGRARPPVAQAVPPYETTAAFPSGHALNNTVVACLIAYLLLLHLSSRLWRTVSVVIAVAWFVTIGLTRVFLGYHWLTDVLAGWLLGLAWAATVITCHRLYLTVERQRSEPPRRPVQATVGKRPPETLRSDPEGAAPPEPTAVGPLSSLHVPNPPTCRPFGFGLPLERQKPSVRPADNRRLLPTQYSGPEPFAQHLARIQ